VPCTALLPLFCLITNYYTAAPMAVNWLVWTNDQENNVAAYMIVF